jgi:twitching motility protein PilT
VSQRLVPKQSGGRLLVTELLGSNLRSREAIALGENENRRLSDVIEAGSTSGWHTFEQSLLKAYEENLVTEETALLYCVNRNQMRQRIDATNKRRDSAPGASSLKMKAAEEAPKPRPVPPPPPPSMPGTPTMSPSMPSMSPAGQPGIAQPSAVPTAARQPAPVQMKPLQMNPAPAVPVAPMQMKPSGT